MKLRPIASALLASLLLAGLAACGGGKTSQTTQAAGPMSAATTEAQREVAALPQSAVVPVPAGLACGAVKPVWVNLRSKAYHEPGDPYYGRTKNGKYLCPAQAQAQGYHAAGSMHQRKRRAKNQSNRMNGMNGSAPEQSPDGNN